MVVIVIEPVAMLVVDMVMHLEMHDTFSDVMVIVLVVVANSVVFQEIKVWVYVDGMTDQSFLIEPNSMLVTV